MENWIELTQTEYDQAWELFDNRFKFKPSDSPENWPSIQVIDDQYVTFALSDTWDNAENLDEYCVNVFQSLVAKEEYIYALDWQHDCFWYNPHLPNGEREWTIPFYPDGDYYIFFPKDLKWCYFSHPWERSVTLINNELILAFIKQKPLIFDEIIRRG